MNIPDIKLPKIPRRFRVSTQKFFNIKQPRSEVRVKNITGLRITHESYRNVVMIYSEFEFKHKWYMFHVDEKPMIMLLRSPSVNGMSFLNSNGLGKIKKELKFWLEKLIKLNRLNIKVQNIKIQKEEEGQEIKLEEVNHGKMPEAYAKVSI